MGRKPDFAKLGFCTSPSSAQRATFYVIVLRQRRVVVAGGHGGSEDQPWKTQTYLPFVHFVQLGIMGVW